MAIEEILSAAESALAENRLENVTDSAGRRWVQIPGHRAHTVEALKIKRDPFEIRLKPRPNRVFYEETTTVLISFLLSYLKARVFFDVGASTGHFSFVAASLEDPTVDVHAFDMQPHGMETIKEKLGQVDIPGRITPHLAGLSDEYFGLRRIWYSRTMMFEEEPAPAEYREPWWIRLKFALQAKDSKRSKLHSAEVLLTTLDRFCQDNALAPDLIKIDVDGYEGKVLQGAQHVLGSIQPVILLELHKDAKQRHGILRHDVVAMLFDAGYQALFITDHQDRARCRLVPAAPDNPLFARRETDMVLFIPPKLA